jgi:hypothetical protein
MQIGECVLRNRTAEVIEAVRSGKSSVTQDSDYDNMAGAYSPLQVLKV